MAKDPDKILDEISKSFIIAFDNATKQKTMVQYAKQLADDIRTRTRLGYGVVKELAKKVKLPKLSDSYVNYRKGKVDFRTSKKDGHVYPITPNSKPKLHSLTTPSKSNLTLSGQMLEAIEGSSPGPGKIKVSLNENRDDGLKNSDIATWLEDGNYGYLRNGPKRPFLHISELEFKRIKDQFRKDIQAKILDGIKKAK